MVAIFFVAPTLGLAAEDEANRSQAELDELSTRLESLQAEQAAAVSEKDLQSKDLRAVEEDIAAIALDVHNLKVEREQIQGGLARLLDERHVQAAAIEAQRRQLGREVRMSFLMGRQERLKLVLNQEDPARLSRMLAYYEYLQRRRVARISDVRAAVERLDLNRRQMEQEQTRLDAVLLEQEINRQRLEVRQIEREQVLARLDADIRKRGGEVARLERDRKRLTGLLDRLQREQERREAERDIEVEARIQQRRFGKLKGKLSWPAQGRINAGFGAPKGSGLRWDGALIAAPAGNEVSVIHGGRVVFADWLKGYGLLMIVDHGDGYMSLYGYNQSLFRSAGDWVTAGEVIGVVGNSGGRSQPALYFGIRHKGKPVDPARWCKRPDRGRVGWNTDGYRRFDYAA